MRKRTWLPVSNFGNPVTELLLNQSLEIAYRNCITLGLHIRTSLDTEIDPMYGELKRRHFWSCLITQAIGQDNAYFRSSSCEDCSGLPLPSDEESFENCSPNITQYLDRNVDAHTLENADPKTSPSVLAELVKLYCYWFVIQRLTW